MNILLINVKNPYVDSDAPPLGLGYIASYIMSRTDDVVRAIDFTVDRLSFDEFGKTYLREFKPDLIGITIVTPTYVYAVELAENIKRICDAHITVGGPHPSALPEETAAEACFDSVVVGEGEKAFLGIRNAIDARETVDTIIYGEPVEDIDAPPLPARSIFPMKKYNMIIEGQKATSIITSCGCPYKCIFCDKSVFGASVRLRSPENIIGEILHLKREYDIHAYYFQSDTFTFNKRFVARFCDLVTEKQLDITWKCITRVDCLTEELLAKMKAAGCVEIIVGVESGNEEILKKIKKGITKQQVIDAVRWARNLELRVKTFFMIGFPWDTETTIKETINFAVELAPEKVQFAVVSPFPKTELRDILEESGIEVSTDWRDYLLKGDDVNFAFSLPHISQADLKRYVELSYQAFDNKEKVK